MYRINFLLGFILSSFIGFAQQSPVDTLRFEDKIILPHDLIFEGVPVFGLSGITYNERDSFYYLIEDKPIEKKTYVFKAKINLATHPISFNIVEKIAIEGDGAIEGESIKFNPNTFDMYISDERKTSSRIYLVNKDLSVKTLCKIRHPFNTGIEGICFSNPGKALLYALEKGNGPKGTTDLFLATLEGKNPTKYSYQLDEIPGVDDKYFGVTDLWTLSDSTFLTIERCYVRSKHKNYVRVYLNKWPQSEDKDIVKIKCLTRFKGPSIGRIDNIEGITLTASGKEIIFITDNNFNPHQQSQIIVMKISE